MSVSKSVRKHKLRFTDYRDCSQYNTLMVKLYDGLHSSTGKYHIVLVAHRRDVKSISDKEVYRKKCRQRKTRTPTNVTSLEHHLLTISYTSCAQAPPLPFTHLVELPYFLYVRWACGPDQHSPAYCTPKTEYPALSAARAHFWTAWLSCRQLPSSLGIARFRVSLKHPIW